MTDQQQPAPQEPKPPIPVVAWRYMHDLPAKLLTIRKAKR